MQKEYENIKEQIKDKIERLKQFIKDFSPFIKQCSQIVWSVEKIQKVKNQKLKRQKTEE